VIYKTLLRKNKRNIRPVCQYALELNDMILNEIVID
jgi:hypothetical protein